MKISFAILLTTLAAAVRASNICVGKPEGILLQNPDDCNTFWQCSHNVAYLHRCPSGLHFNPQKDLCDHPGNVDCPSAGSGSSTTTAPTTTVPTTTTSTSQPTTTPTTRPPTTSRPTTVFPASTIPPSPIKCPEGEEVTFFPSEENCESYFICVHGSAIEMKCPNGLHWNADKETCDRPESAGCQVQESTTPSTSTIIPSTSTRYPGDEDFECPNSDDVTFFPNKKSCQKYFICARRQLIEMQCPLNLHWNQAILTCDLPENSGCTEGEGSATKPSIVPTPSTTPSDEGVFQCPEDNEGKLIFFPSTKSCEKYYVCLNGGLHEMECAFGLHWNQEAHQCDWPEVAGCKIVMTPTTAPVTLTPILPIETTTRQAAIDECPRIGTAVLPHPFICDRYIFCQNGVETVQQCPHYYNFDYTKLVCLLKNVARCFVEEKI